VPTSEPQQIARFQGPHLQTDSAMGMQAAARIHSISRSARSMIDGGIERLKRSCRFHVYQHLEFAWLFDRQIRGFRPFENLVHVLGGTLFNDVQVRSVGNQAAGFDKLTCFTNSWQAPLGCEIMTSRRRR
jgi:hypothetical protein